MFNHNTRGGQLQIREQCGLPSVAPSYERQCTTRCNGSGVLRGRRCAAGVECASTRPPDVHPEGRNGAPRNSKGHVRGRELRADGSRGQQRPCAHVGCLRVGHQLKRELASLFQAGTLQLLVPGTCSGKKDGFSVLSRNHLILQGAKSMFGGSIRPDDGPCMQVLHFRVNESAVNGITCVAGQELLLVASADTCVHMYNYNGGLVGTFGVHVWVLDDVATHQDPEAENTSPVLDVIESLCNVAAARKEVAGAFFTITPCILLVLTFCDAHGVQIGVEFKYTAPKRSDRCSEYLKHPSTDMPRLANKMDISTDSDCRGRGGQEGEGSIAVGRCRACILLPQESKRAHPGIVSHLQPIRKKLGPNLGPCAIGRTIADLLFVTVYRTIALLYG